MEQLRRVREGASDSALVATSKCLDACEHSNVIVVVPGDAARHTEPDPVWFGEMNDPELTEDLIDWVNEKGPESVSIPVSLNLARFTPTRASRHELGSGAVMMPSSGKLRRPR